ncbi:hypothetical protein GW17_00054775 [Ensete ventricosum]|nr:hypothetical protein GW17_00054775 [Ensete ventricosum]
MMGRDQAWTSGRGSDDVVGPRQEFARRFTEGIRKLARNMQGDHRKKTKKLTAKILEAVVLAGTWRLDGFSIRGWEERVHALAGEGHHSIRGWECDMNLSPLAVGRIQTHPVG